MSYQISERQLEMINVITDDIDGQKLIIGLMRESFSEGQLSGLDFLENRN